MKMIAEINEETTIGEALGVWDDGGIIESITLGGIGPGYEQTIQLLLFELCKDNLKFQDWEKLEADENKWRRWGDETVSRLDKYLLFSGAQVGAAKRMASQFLRYGYGKMIEKMKAEDHGRMILVSKKFPRLPD